MRNQIKMSEFNSVYNLPEKIFHLFLTQVMLLDILIQLPSLCDFHDDKDVIGGIEHLIELYDIGMIDKFQYFDFPFHLSDWNDTFEIILTFLIFSLLMILTATGRLVRSCFASGVEEIFTFNLGKTTLSQSFTQNVMSYMYLFSFNYVRPVHRDIIYDKQ